MRQPEREQRGAHCDVGADLVVRLDADSVDTLLVEKPGRVQKKTRLFGCIEALIPQLAAAGVQLPQYFVLMTPYLVTLGVMVWVALGRRQGTDAEPGALGEPYVREERR